MPLYFAYGSNLKRTRIEDQRLKRKLGPAERAVLRGYRLAFNKVAQQGGSGYANAVASCDGVVWGVLYDVTYAELDVLDEREGVSGGHYKQVEVEVERESGARTTAVTYLAGADHVREGLMPTVKYLALVVEGAAEHHLDAKYIDEIRAIGGGRPAATKPVVSTGHNLGYRAPVSGTAMKNTDRQRTALRALARDTLSAVTERLGLAVGDKRKAEAHVDAIVDAARVDDALGILKRDDLKEMCRAVGVDDSGKEKDPIAGRLTQWFQSGDANFNLESQAAPAPKEKKAAKAPKAKTEALPLGDVAADYRHDEAKRTNNPPAGLVEFDKPPPRKKREYAYDPHLDPQLQWAGKAEHTSFEVDTVSLHIHERVSTQAILRAVKRDEAEPQMNLFARPELPAAKEVDFYSHDVGWSNRLILGDSLLVMNSLLERENMAGQVQCFLMDPPYGVKFNSNFQPSISRRDVKDGDEGLTREPEQIQAYRDTWELGVHSYLTYLRDRLLLARDLLNVTGSVFVQISDENIHHVRELLDEVFGPENFISQIAFTKTSSQTSNFIPSVADYLLWYAKDRTAAKFRELFAPKAIGGRAGAQYTFVEEEGTRVRRRMTADELSGAVEIRGRVFRPDNFTGARQGRTYGSSGVFPIKFEGRDYLPGGGRSWSTNEEGAQRLIAANRFYAIGNTLCYVRYLDDFPVVPFSNVWDDTGSSGFGDQRIYAVQTSVRAIARCILQTTDPGDLVFDPTCGSGTTAFVSEQWGRRWITCDTSRVALSLARQRMLTSKFPFYRLRSGRVKDGFIYKSVPHVTLRSIAQNSSLVTGMTGDEIDAIIARDAEQETLHDQPETEPERAKVRVTGPFTVEAIPLASMEDPSRDVDGPVSKSAAVPGHFSDETSQYLSMMMDLLRQTGVNFPGNKKLRLPSLRAVKGDYEWFHAEGNSDAEGDPRRFAVSFGPRHGPVTTTQVMQAIKETRGCDVLLFTGFACDPEARKMIDQGMHGTELLFANAAPDILVGDLLKKKRTDQLFAVYGAPDVKVHNENGGSLVSVELVGVDLYDPNTGETKSAKGTDAAALFVDHDYDGKSFCISQALFPGGNNPWEKLQKALKGQIDEEKFAALQTARSLPFRPGNKVAVKVIDDRGNEVIKIVDARKALKK